MVTLPDLPVPEPDAGEVRDTVRDVLAQEAYEDLQPTLLDRLWELVRNGIGRFLELLEATGTGGMLGVVIIVVVALVLLLLTVQGLRRMRRTPTVDEPLVGVAGRTGDDWRADAAAAEAAGRHRDAVRCRYRALVADFAAAGLVEEVPGRTVGEYRGAVAQSAPGAAPAFDRASEVFERAWYADLPVTADDTAELAAAVDEASKAAEGRRPAGAGSGA